MVVVVACGGDRLPPIGDVEVEVRRRSARHPARTEARRDPTRMLCPTAGAGARARPLEDARAPGRRRARA